MFLSLLPKNHMISFEWLWSGSHLHINLFLQIDLRELDVEKPSIGSLANTMSCFLGNILGMSEGIRY